jgi:thymidylate synthase
MLQFLHRLLTNHPEYQYLDLLSDVLKNGTKKSIFAENGKTLPTIDRNQYSEVDKDSKFLSSVFVRNVRYDCSKSIPLYTTKAVYYPGAFKEMLWFIKGNGDISALNQQKVPIWNGWAYKQHQKYNGALSYAEFVSRYLNSGTYFVPVPYTDATGWKVVVDGQEKVINQTKWLIDEIKKAPERKSYVVSSWNPARLYGMAKAVGSESVAIAACHLLHQVVVNDGKLNLFVLIRSSDSGLGHPFNIAQYALLLRMYAHCTGFTPGELVVTLVDAHIYSDQISEIEKQVKRTPKPFPQLTIEDRGQKYLEDFDYSDFSVEGYFPEESIRMPLTVVGGF